MIATDDRRTRRFLYTVYFIYFFCGMTLCFEGVFLPEFKEHFKLGYQQQMYTMFAKNIPFLLAPLIGSLIQRLGFKPFLSIAMCLYAAGTLLLPAGLHTGVYTTVLLAFFIIGLGFNFQLVAGNPLLSGLGPVSGSSSRLNFGNALGAIAQIIAPLILTLIIPATVVNVSQKLPYMTGLFSVIGALLIVIAIVTFFTRNVDLSTSFQASGSTHAAGTWMSPKLILAFVTIFLALGAEAGLFGLYRNYLEEKSIGGLSSHQSQEMFTVYFAIFAAGRIVGGWIQRRVKPALSLAVAAIVALALIGVIVSSSGWLAIGSVTLLGFFISIFFPTLYSLAIEGMGERTAQASGFLTMGFLGCALLPVLQGKVADQFGLQQSYCLCVVPYMCVLLYALKSHKLSALPPRPAL